MNLLRHEVPAKKQLFETQNFYNTVKDPSRHNEFFYAYLCVQIINATDRGYTRDRNNKHGVAQYGNGLVYGKYAIVTACRLRYENEKSLEEAGRIVGEVLKRWLSFEAYAISLKTNSSYFKIYKDEKTGIEKQELNFDNYYKGKTINHDVVAYFSKK